MGENDFHRSTLLNEATHFLKVEKNGFYIDATLGGGGHTERIIGLGGKVLALDFDPAAIAYSSQKFGLKLDKRSGRLIAKDQNLILVQENFANLSKVAKDFGLVAVNGIIFDLGVSSYQLKDNERGFSFLADSRLDMRMSPDLEVSAADLVNALNEGELYELFNKFGEEHFSRRIARAIVRYRIKKKIANSKQLAEIVETVVGRREKIHPATRVFQALRIAVNDELNSLRRGLGQATDLLIKKGRLVVISFHSLEDRIVKNFFKDNTNLKVLTAKPIRPTREEVLENPSCASAKMRVAEKI